MQSPLAERKVGEVGDNEVDRPGHGVEQIALEDDDPVEEPVVADVLAGEGHGGRARVGRPHAGLRGPRGDGDRQRARPGADVGDGRGPVADHGERGLHEAFARGPRCHDDTRARAQGEAAEMHVSHEGRL